MEDLLPQDWHEVLFLTKEGLPYFRMPKNKYEEDDYEELNC
jgi:hypothetical protein